MKSELTLNNNSLSLEDVAWLEDAKLIFFLIFRTSVIWLGRQMSRCSSWGKNYRQMYGGLEKLTETFLAKLHPSNLVNTIFYLVYFNVLIHKLCKIQIIL